MKPQLPCFPSPVLSLATAVLSAAAVSAQAGLSFNTLASFPAGQTSTTSLTQGPNGNFYGVSSNGGAFSNGAIFELIMPKGNGTPLLTNLFSFAGSNGSAPTGPLYFDNAGNIYGETWAGGSNSSSGGGGGRGGSGGGGGGSTGNGTLFEFTTANQLHTLVNFNSTDGSHPTGGLVLGPHNVFYGVTSSGGSNSDGEIFAWSSSLGLSNVFSFSGTNGSAPQGRLVYATNGNFYGVTSQGGTSGLGTLFELSPTNTLNTLSSFTFNVGAFPNCLVQSASASNFYGATLSGGSGNVGALFSANSSGRLSSLFSFNITNGSGPLSTLLLGRDGNLYGATEQGGLFGTGAIFEITPTASGAQMPLLVSLQGASGTFPLAGLTQGSDGNLYGTTTRGGANNSGTIFQILGFGPSIVVQPSTVNFASNRAVSFSVTAAGTSPLSFQWQFDAGSAAGSIFSSTTNSVLKLTPAELANAGSYTVIVSNAYGMVTSSVAELAVPAPTITITSPTKGQIVTVSNIVVSGTAADNFGVSNVMFEVNGSTNFTLATGSTRWQGTANLQPGSNVITAFSADPLGNHSATASITIFYAVPATITLQTNGDGSIRHAGFSGNQLIYQSNYTVTAAPAPGNLFLNWTSTLGAKTNNPLTFTMPSNLVLTANFVTNPYPAAAATYLGLFYDTNQIAPQSSGDIRGLQLGKQGGFTATLDLSGASYGFTGQFNASGLSTNQITRASGLSALTVALSLNSAATPPQITGTVSGNLNGPWTAALVLEPVAKLTNTAAFTLLIPPGTNANSPTGEGYAVITNHHGNFTLTGALADGTSFTHAFPETQNAALPVYFAPYSGAGLVEGWLDLSGGSPQGALAWIRPAAATGLFTNGFTNIVDVQSSLWQNPAVATNLPNPSENLFIFGGPLSASIDFQAAIDYSAEDIQVTGATNSFTSAINPKTGLLQITFGNGLSTNTTKATGVILQDNATGGGYFLTRTNSGGFTLTR